MRLSDGATRALLRHNREDGPLNGSFLGEDDAEELYFCSMLNAVAGGERLVTRSAWTSSLSGETTYKYQLTQAGKLLRAKLSQPPVKNGEG